MEMHIVGQSSHHLCTVFFLFWDERVTQHQITDSQISCHLFPIRAVYVNNDDKNH